jgi:hypothetical protein
MQPCSHQRRMTPTPQTPQLHSRRMTPTPLSHLTAQLRSRRRRPGPAQAPALISPRLSSLPIPPPLRPNSPPRALSDLTTLHRHTSAFSLSPPLDVRTSWSRAWRTPSQSPRHAMGEEQIAPIKADSRTPARALDPSEQLRPRVCATAEDG